MITDPERRGAELASFYLAVEPRLYRDLEDSGLFPPAALEEPELRAKREWECFALYACVRGLVAAGGFNRETATAIDALHQHVLAEWMDEGVEEFEARRARVSERYAEYGALGQEGGAAGASAVSLRLGLACARHVLGGAEPDAALAEMIGSLHETLAEGAAEAVRMQE